MTTILKGILWSLECLSILESTKNILKTHNQKGAKENPYRVWCAFGVCRAPKARSAGSSCSWQCKKQPEAFNAPSAESALLASYLLAKQLHLMFVSSPSATQGWLLESICLRLQRFKSLPLSHYLQICPCNILFIFTLANLHLSFSQQKHPSHAWRSVQSQGLEPIQTSRRLQDSHKCHKSKKRCLWKHEIFLKTFALLPSCVHLFHGEKEKKAGDFCDKSQAMKCCETLNVACKTVLDISLPSAQTPNLRRTLRSWKLGRKENAADAILGWKNRVYRFT